MHRSGLIASFLLLRYCKEIIGSFFFILLFFISEAQPEDYPAYNFKHYTDEDGLPQNSVKAIVGDKDGFIWLATENGLVRYDGQSFVTFNSSTLPIKSSRFGALIPSADRSNTFFALSDQSDYLFVKDGKVLVDSSGFRRFLSNMPFSKEYGTFVNYFHALLPNTFSGSINSEKCIIADTAGGFFVSDHETVSYYKGGQRRYELIFRIPDFWSFFRMGASLYWARGNQFNAIRKGEIHNLKLTGDLPENPQYHPGTSRFEIFWGNAAGQAFIYFDKNLYQVFEDSAENLVTREVLNGFDCRLNNINTVYYDSTSYTVFLGSWNKGLFTFSRKRFMPQILGGNDEGNIYYAQSAWGPDQVLTTQGHVIGLSKHVVLPAMKKEGVWDKYSMAIDSNGYIWTKKGDRINKFDPKAKSLLSTWDLKTELTQIYCAPDGKIWIGSRKGGLFWIDPSDKMAKPQPFPLKHFIPEISFVTQEDKDRLWIGSWSGLYHLQLSTGQVDSISGLENAYIRSIYIPSPGQVWVTTYGNGFFLYSNGKLTRFPVDKAGYLYTSHCIVEDEKGFFWITTNKGLFQVSKQDLLNYATGIQKKIFYLYYAQDEGFNTNEFNGGCQPCAVKLANGYVSLPSLYGLVWFAPGIFENRVPDKKIFIDKILVDDTLQRLQDTIRISRGFKLLKVYCSSPYNGNGYNVNIEYAWVKGKEDTIWLALDNSDKIISQPGLGQGTYSLLLRKQAGFGNNNYTYRKLTIVVPAAFYESYWFYGAMAAVLVLLFWLYTHLRLKYIRNKNRQLESLISERTEELLKALSALSVSEQNIRRQMQVREVFFTAISHDIGSPLRYITMIAENLKISLAKDHAQSLEAKYADGIFQSGHYLYYLTRNLLQYLRISDEGNSLHFEQFNLHALIQTKVRVFEPIANERVVTIINEVPEQYELYSDPLVCEVVVHNLLDNAIKAALKGTIRIYIREGQLIIEDSGPGMSKVLADHYSGRSPYPDDNSRLKQGFGLEIVQELTQLSGIGLNIETSPTGTKICLSPGRSPGQTLRGSK